jgi:transcriptional regulator GlxA family with amidase domain
MPKLSSVLLLLPLVACQSTPDPAPAPQPAIAFELDTSQKLNVGIVVVDGVYNTELTAPMDMFQHTIFHDEVGMRVFLVGPNLEPVTSFEGLRVLPDYGFDDAPQIDILVVPSAEHSMDTDLKDAALMDFVRTRGEAAGIVLSLCDGAFVLAGAGLLDGLQATTFPSDINAMERAFPAVDMQRGVSFVRQGKFVTSVGGEPSFDASLFICERLYGAKAARGIAGGLIIDWDLKALDYIEKP